MSFNAFIKFATKPIIVITAVIALNQGSLAQQPTPAALATAKEIIKTTGATALFNPLIPGVIEQAKNLLLQQNPGLSKDLNEIAAKLRTDLAPRFDELTNEVAKLYATHFTEPELRDLLAFYKTPVGTKLILEQPKIGEEGLRFAQDWANGL
ncbi:MAG TPA: DUF2059 domain-containing protein, partial [Pseudolabrys sp.]|nr:DUF2059 domain-containing protein [Pseudolabrys sp.]